MHWQAKLINLASPPKAVAFLRCYDICFLMPILAALRQRGVTLVADIDDLLFEPTIVDQIGEYEAAAFSNQQAAFLIKVAGYQRVLAACQKGTAPTTFLASRMSHIVSETTVIPNTVNEAQLQLASDIIASSSVCDVAKERLTIIYLPGVKKRHQDVEKCFGALAKFMRERSNVYFHLVGTQDLPDCFADFQSRIRYEPFVPYLKLLPLTAAAEINIAPLEKSTFNHAKSELKIFEAGLVQVPTIASRVDSYARYITDGVDGLLADTEEEWFCAFSKLAQPGARPLLGFDAQKFQASRGYHGASPGGAADTRH
jgi:glycosyltransferase involved in cell wall biosynthesis